MNRCRNYEMIQSMIKSSIINVQIRGSQVPRQQLRIARNRDGREVSQVQRRDSGRFEAGSGGNDDGVHQSHPKLRVALGDNVRRRQIVLIAPRHAEPAVGEIGNEGLLCPRADVGANEVIDLRQDCPRQQPCGGIALYNLRSAR